MAKGNGHKGTAKGNGDTPAPAAYFKSLTIENVKCFKGEHTIDLSDGKGKPAQWTVILGNNNTGKTTILKCLAGLENTTISAIDHNNREFISESLLVSDLNWPSENFDLEMPFTISATVLFQLNLVNTSEDKGSSNKENKLSFHFAEDFEVENNAFSSGKWIFWGKNRPGFLKMYSYGATRRSSREPISILPQSLHHSNLFSNIDLLNTEDWLLNLFLAEQLGQVKAKRDLYLSLDILTKGILPDVSNVRITSIEKSSSFDNFIEFETDFGWVRLSDLGYGYQSMISWVLDLVKRMVERYPNSPNPLAEPAIVLVDEIDLHLHPDWQRRIIAHLTKHFPNTQFIVTAHSPLVVQSADEVNVVILKKEGDAVTIEQPDFRTFKGWTVEEILTDLMQLEGQTMSQTYIDLRAQFDEALDEDDYAKAKDAFDKLAKILHPTSTQRKLMQLQMTSLSPEAAL